MLRQFWEDTSWRFTNAVLPSKLDLPVVRTLQVGIMTAVKAKQFLVYYFDDFSQFAYF